MITGMYGGKFFPMHKGHLYCLEQALKICDKVYLVLVVGGRQEKELNSDLYMLSREFRWKQVQKVAEMFPGRVEPRLMDVSECYDENGNEDWDKETPLMIALCGKFDYVFGSEPEYKYYFNRAYPWAEYRLVDVKREHRPISATMIRNMSPEEAKKWIIEA